MEETTKTNTKKAGKKAGKFIKAVATVNHSCEIAGKKINLIKGEKINLTPFEFATLTNPHLVNKLVKRA